MRDPMDRILERLENVKEAGQGFTARCPAHEDRHSSLSVRRGDDGRVLVKCFVGCTAEQIVAKLDMEMRDLFPQADAPIGMTRTATAGTGGGAGQSPAATPQPRNPLSKANNPGCTLDAYAEMKRLPVDSLKSHGLAQITYCGAPAVSIPYKDVDGATAATRFRTALMKTENGDDRFKWKKGSKPILYGLWRLGTPEYIALVEGESDCHTLWHHDIPALGLPGAAMWREEWAAHLDGIAAIYVVIEPDSGGEAVKRWLATSCIRERVRLITLSGLGVTNG